MIDTAKGIIFLGVTLWVLVFGVNVSGKHYGLDFSTHGVSLIWGK